MTNPSTNNDTSQAFRLRRVLVTSTVQQVNENPQYYYGPSTTSNDSASTKKAVLLFIGSVVAVIILFALVAGHVQRKIKLRKEREHEKADTEKRQAIVEIFERAKTVAEINLLEYQKNHTTTDQKHATDRKGNLPLRIGKGHRVGKTSSLHLQSSGKISHRSLLTTIATQSLENCNGSSTSAPDGVLTDHDPCNNPSLTAPISSDDSADEVGSCCGKMLENKQDDKCGDREDSDDVSCNISGRSLSDDACVLVDVVSNVCVPMGADRCERIVGGHNVSCDTIPQLSNEQDLVSCMTHETVDDGADVPCYSIRLPNRRDGDDDADSDHLSNNTADAAGITNSSWGNLLVDSCCAICLEPYEHGQRIVWSTQYHHDQQCSHAYHQDCIVEYILARHPTEDGNIPCPTCRQSFVIVKRTFDDDRDDDVNPDTDAESSSGSDSAVD